MQDGNGSSALAVVEPPHQQQALAVSEYHRRATDVAGLVREMVLKRTVKIGAKNYVPVECYQAVANAMGCVGSARDVKRVEGGYTAIGEVKRLSDGVVVAEGEGFVGDDEPKWAKGPEYARRSMVQTRAIGRACRAAFAFIVPMIDAGLSTTPAEEMDGLTVGTETPPAPVRGNAAVKAALRPSPPQSVGAAVTQHANEPPPHTDADFRDDPPAKPMHIPTAPPTHDRSVSFRFGNAKGTPLHKLTEGDLKFYEKCLVNDAKDPAKAQYAAANTLALANVQAELRYRGI